MDAVYRGLAAPRQVIPLGRADIDPSERPGAALSGLAREALDTGAFPAGPAPLPPIQAERTGSVHEAQAYDDGADPENEIHLPDDDEPTHEEADHDEGLDT